MTMKPNKLGKKIVASVTLIAFLTVSCFQQVPPAYAVPENTAAVSPLTDINIPERLGRVEEIWRGQTGKQVVFIQDAHSSLECQRHIAVLITRLVKREGFKTVFEEGYEGAVPSDFYFQIPEPRLKAKVAYFFLDHLRIGGAEFAHINRQHDFSLIGAEDLKNYLDNVRQYGQASRITPLISSDLGKIETALAALESRLFPKSFMAWYRLKKRFDAGRLSLADYLKRTFRDESSGQYPGLSKLTGLLRHKGAGDARNDFAQIESKKIFAELAAFEDEEARRHLTDPEARRLYFYLDSLRILKLLSSLTVSQEQFDVYRQKIRRLKTREILRFLSAYQSKPVLLSSLWEDWIQETLRFYELAEKRESAVEKVLKGDWDKAILVFGGFHRKGISRVLKKMGISYVIVSPRISRPDPKHEKRYQYLMSGAFYDFEKGGPLSGAAKAPSLYVSAPSLDSRELIQRVALAKESRPEFDAGAAEYMFSAASLGSFLGKTRGQAVLGAAAVDAYLESLRHTEVRDLPDYFLEVIPALVKGIENDFLRVETLGRIVEALRESGHAKPALRKALVSLKTGREETRLIRELFDFKDWGITPHHDFIYRQALSSPLARIVPGLETKSPDEILKRLRVYFGHTPAEAAVILKNLFPVPNPLGLTKDDWTRVCNAMRYENRFVQETRLGGFRRVKGIKRANEAPRRVFVPHVNGTLERFEKVYGLPAGALDKMVEQEWGEGKSLEDLNPLQMRLIQDRLHDAGKRRFENLDRHRYSRKEGLIRRGLDKPGFYWNELRRKGIFALFFDVFNDLLSTVLGVLVRWPLHFLEVFFFGYYRTEIFYEHLLKNQDFLGQARSEAVVREALRDIKNNRKRFSDRLNSGVPGAVNKALDRFLLGSILKGTLRFLVKRIHIAVLCAAAVGWLATFGAPVLSMGLVVSSPALAAMFSGVWGLGSLFSFLAGVPIFGNLTVFLTVGNVSQSLILAVGLVAPRALIQGYRNRRLADPEAGRIKTVFKAFLFDLILSPRFWRQVFATTVGMILVGAEISAIVQYAAATDWFLFGKDEEIVAPSAQEAADGHANPLHSLLTGKVRVEGIDHELHGPVFTRAAGLVEGDALYWGNQILDSVQNRLGFNLSDYLFHRLGGPSGVHAAEVMQTAHLLAQVRYQLAHEMPAAADNQELEQRAAIYETLAAQDQAGMKTLAFELAHLKPEEAVRLMSLMQDETLGRVAREYAKKDFRGMEARVAVLGESLKILSPAKHSAFKLSFAAGRVEFETDADNQALWVRAFQEIADSGQSVEKTVLRAVASALDNLRPELTVALLKQAERPLFLEKILDEAVFIPITRKERLVRLLRESGMEKGAPGAAELPQRSFGQKDNLASENLLLALRNNRENILNDPVRSLNEITDIFQSLMRYAGASGNPEAAQELTRDYEWLASRRLAAGDEIPAGLAYLRFSKYFSGLALKARTGGDADTQARYEALALDARERGLREAGSSHRMFRILLNQREAERVYSRGRNYADMIELFEEAYEATGHDRWYEALRHAAENVLNNQVMDTKKVMPEYQEIERDRYFLNVNGEKLDFFDVLENTDPRVRVAVARMKLPAFEVGPNESLKRNMVESGLDVISQATVADASGNVLDRLSFHYDPHGRLTAIQSEKGLLESRKEVILAVKNVQVYQQDLKTGIPYGMTYQYVYNAAGRLQYIVKKDYITLEEIIIKHPVNAILKDSSGRALSDLDIPGGLRPNRGNFRVNEELEAGERFDFLGSALQALYRLKVRAEAEKDWKLAAFARNAASSAILSFYDARGRIQSNAEGLFSLYGRYPDEGKDLEIHQADAKAQAYVLTGLAPWVNELEQARELYESGARYFEGRPDQEAGIQALLVLASTGRPAASGAVPDEILPGEYRKDLVRDFTRYVRYAGNTANFKFAKVEMRKMRLDEDMADTVFLQWEPLPQAMWYLVREYQKAADGSWQLNKKNDRWVRSPFLALEDPTGTEKRYAVAAFTADPVFESYGPLHGVHSLSSEAKTVEKPGNIARPGQPHLIVPERHGVGGHEEWIDLGKTYEVVAREMKRFPHARGAEWEIATDRHFKNVVAAFKTEKDIPGVYLRGLADGNYYVRVRLWSNTREILSREWKDLGPQTLTGAAVPGFIEPGRVSVRDESVAAWIPAAGAHFYKVSIGFQDGELRRFVRDGIVTSSPFINVREHTAKSVNWIEITPYTAHPDMGGIAGSPSGRIAIAEIKGADTEFQMEGVAVSPKDETYVCDWKPVEGAKVYRIDTMSRGEHDQPFYESFWAPEYATRYPLQTPAKFVRVQAWSDVPEKGGRPLSEYSAWVRAAAEFKTPDPVFRESIKAENGQVRFDRVENAAGYHVITRNHRGSVYTYWVAQPSAGEKASLRLVMDADVIEITPSTKRVGGLIGPTVKERILAEVSHDDELILFLTIDESAGRDENANGRIDAPYFYYDLDRIPVEKGDKVYLQYATQYGGGEVVTYPMTNGKVFYPRQNADRVRVRVVRVSENGDMTVADWSNWHDFAVRLELPPLPAGVFQEGARTLAIRGGELTQRSAGYVWETRVDLNDPEDEPVIYRTIVRRHNGTVADAGDNLPASRNANWVRVRSVKLDAYGELVSEQWSEWQLVQVRVEDLPSVQNVHSEAGNRLVFAPQTDERVNGYLIEFTNDPADGLQPVSTYTQRVIREQGKVIQPGNEFQIPVRARYARVTSLMIKSENDRIEGEKGEWVRIDSSAVKVFPRMIEPTHHGRLVLGRSVEGAEYYRIQTRDAQGQIRSYMSKTPWAIATGSFAAYRIQALNGSERNGLFVAETEGEWTAWRTVKDVIAERQPPAPELRLTQVKGIEVIAWDPEYLNEQYGVTKYFYVIEFEDENGNRTTTDVIEHARVYPVGFKAVRARIKALKPMLSPQKFEVLIDSESEWSPWKEIRPYTLGLDNAQPIVSRYPGGTTIDIQPVNGADLYQIQFQHRSGDTGSVVHLKEDLFRRTGGRITVSDKGDPLARVRVQVFAKNTVLGAIESPLFDHGWVHVPGVKVEPLPPPTSDGVRPAPLPGRSIALVAVGFNKDGHIYYLGREGRPRPRVDGNYDYIGYIAVEESKPGGVEYRRSPVSDLKPLRPAAASAMPAVQDPVVNQIPREGVLTWDPVRYQLTIQEKENSGKPPVITVSENEFAPDELIERGRDAYDVHAEEIIGYFLVFRNKEGYERRVFTQKNFLNLGDVPPGDYDEVRLSYLVKGDFQGAHGDWSEARGLVVRHEEELVLIRPVSETLSMALFKDGMKVFYSRTGILEYGLMPGPEGDKRLSADEVPAQYRLTPEDVFSRGERWSEVKSEDLQAFNEIYFKNRRVIQNDVWRVTVPNYVDEKPLYLLGLPSSGSIHLKPEEGQPVMIANGSFVMASKRYENTNPGSIEAKWSSNEQGLDVYTRKYLLDGIKAGVLEFSAHALREGAPSEAVLALRASPDSPSGQIRVTNAGGFVVFTFSNGQFTAVPKKDLAGWYLGSQAREAEENPGLQNNLETFEGPQSHVVLYLRVSTQRLDHVFILSGEAEPGKTGEVVLEADKQIRDYEKAFESFGKHGSRTGSFSRETLELFFNRQLSGRAWREFPDGTGTYWEMVGVDDRGPANTAWTDASWIGNSALMQQLNIRMHRQWLEEGGADAEAAHRLVAERIIPNAEWMVGHMQTPTDSFYMKTGDAMRVLFSEGKVLLDNQLMSAVMSMRRGIPLMRGYEPLDAFTIAGSGFETESAGQARFDDLRGQDFDFRLVLEEDGKFDPAQPELQGTRLYERTDGSYNVRESVTLKKGEYGVRYALDLEARRDLEVKKVGVALSHLDADQQIQRNPEGFPGFQGENGLIVPGVDGVLRARELFERSGQPSAAKGQWIDLVSLLEENGRATPKSGAVKKALREIGSLGIMGWDKGGFLYMKEGIDYAKGYRVMVKIDEKENDEDEDNLLEFTDIRIEIPVDEARQHMKAGEHYQSPEVFFTNFWVRLAVTDKDQMPEDLKHMVFDWIAKLDAGQADSLSMESDYAYTESAIALWETANFMLDESRRAGEQGRAADAEKFSRLARRYGMAAMRATLASRDADKSTYDVETGNVRRDVMSTKGVMRFYGTYAVLYSMARDFKTRIGEDMEDELIAEAESQAGEYLAKMKQASSPKEYARYKAYHEIYWSKAARWRALKTGQNSEALDAFVRENEAALERTEDSLERGRIEMDLYYAKKQRDYLRVLSPYASYLPASSRDYWALEILWSADKILELQELNRERPNYGGFYQNEQPSKMQLDDNATKLWALRVAYEFVDRKINEILATPGVNTLRLPELTKLYESRRAYAQAARLNIERWVRVDERDGHLYGWESHERPEDYDSQRTEYGNAVYRLHGLGSWMDLAPAAKKKFDSSSRQHQEERPDGTRNFSPRGFKMYVAYDNPGNGNDTSTEVAPTELMAYLSRAQGGSFRKDPAEVRLARAGDPVAPSVTRREYTDNLPSEKELLALLQLAVEANILFRLARGLLRLVQKLWAALAGPFRSYSFLAYSAAILVITAVMGYGYVEVHEIERTNPWVLTFMVGMLFYIVKNVAETLARFFKMGMFRDKDRIRGNSELDRAPFRQAMPMHLGTMLSVPLYTTGPKDARISHGEPDESAGAFHNAVMKNLDAGPGLFFHINDQSPDRADQNGFNPKQFHENYIRAMTERHGRRFVYTHQPGNTEKKLGAVQAADSFWYALQGTVLPVLADLWDSLEPAEQTEVKRSVYGRRVEIGESEFSGGGEWQIADGLRVSAAAGTVSIEYLGETFEAVPVPGQAGTEIKMEFKIKRTDGLTALMPVWIRRTQDSYQIYFYNENPDGNNVLIEEEATRAVPGRRGLLPLEKEAMIEAEARAALYRFWASEYGGTRGGEATSGQSDIMPLATRHEMRAALAVSGRSADEVFGRQAGAVEVPGGFAFRLSQCMVEQNTDYFDKVRDVLGNLTAADLRALLPRPFDTAVQAWTDTDLIPAPVDAGLTVPFELEVGKRAVPGAYYHVNPGTGRLEPYENPALEMMDEAARRIDQLMSDPHLDGFTKKKNAEAFLQTANPVLRNIREIMPVTKSFRVLVNEASGRTEVLEEQWILYQYTYEDGRTEIFFKPERKRRFDTLIGHLPSVGPLSYMWRFDNDTTTDFLPGEADTLVRGALRAGHPHYQPVIDLESGQAVLGYGGMVLPMRVANDAASYWSELEARNREKVSWDLEGQWEGFGEVQYTGKGIESLESAERAKAHAMPKGFYLSHDMLEAGYSGPGVYNMRLRRLLQEQGLTGAFLEGVSHRDFERMVEFVWENFRGENGNMIFKKYGLPLSREALRELLMPGASGGGMGLLSGMAGYEDYFESHRDTLFKVMGQWKKGDFQWLHASWLGVDIRGAKKVPGAMPGHTVSERRSMEQTVAAQEGNIRRVMTGQEYKPNPLTDVHKYYISRTVEEDQRGAVMFVWLMATVLLSVLDHSLYTLVNVPVLSFLLLLGSVALIVGIMKFAKVFSDIKKEGLTFRNARQLSFAVTDTVLESIIVSGINLWKAWVSTLRLIFRVPGMKWITGAQLGERPTPLQAAREYGVGVLLGFSLVGFVVAFHPTSSMLIFGGVFLGSLILGPFFAWMTAQEPGRARAYLWSANILLGLVIAGIILLPHAGISYAVLGKFLMRAAVKVGVASFAGLVLMAVIKILMSAVSAGYQRAGYALRQAPALIVTAVRWLRGLFSLDPTLLVIVPVKRHFAQALQFRKLTPASVSDYFLVRGSDRSGYFSSRAKAFGNLITVAALWALPFIFPQAFSAAVLGTIVPAVALKAFYVGLFFPIGFMVLDKILDPERPFFFLNPFDYARTVFHLVSASTGILAALAVKLTQSFVTAAALPHAAGTARVFLRKGGEASARKTAHFLMSAKAGTRKRFAVRLARAADAEEKFMTLVQTRVLDDQMIQEIAEPFFALRATGGEQSVPLSPGDMETLPEENNKNAEGPSAQSLGAVNADISADRRPALFGDIQNLRGAVILDARSFSKFSPAQRDEIVKSVLSGRAQAVIYGKDKVPAGTFGSILGIKNIRVISEGADRALKLLAGEKNIVHLFDEAFDPRAEYEASGAVNKAKLFRQIEGGEEGLLTAALLAVQYGDKAHSFREENGAYVLVNPFILRIVQEFLSHELISQAA